MNTPEARVHRLAAFSGLAIAGAVALWWLGSTRLALQHGADASRASAQALLVLWAVRAVVMALMCARVATLCGWRAGLQTALGVVAPAWPLMVLAGSASAWPWLLMLGMETALWAAAGVVVGLGHMGHMGHVLSNRLGGVAGADGHPGTAPLHRSTNTKPWADLVGTAIGAACALALWFLQGVLTPGVP